MPDVEGDRADLGSRPSSVGLVSQQHAEHLEGLCSRILPEADAPLPDSQPPFGRLDSPQADHVALSCCGEAHDSRDDPLLNRWIEA
jgi:hypothetical protein